MRLLMVAPPGAGKGTQSERLAQRYGVEHISSGELLRAEVAAGTPTGREAAEYLRRGDLVPDDLVLGMIAGRVVAAAAGKGYVLDGYPRNLAQARAAHEVAARAGNVTLQAVLHLDVPRGSVLERLLARARSEGRRDDALEVIEHRLEVFDRETEPLLGYYEERGILHTIDGSPAPDLVTEAIVALLGRLGLS